MGLWAGGFAGLQPQAQASALPSPSQAESSPTQPRLRAHPPAPHGQTRKPPQRPQPQGAEICKKTKSKG